MEQEERPTPLHPLTIPMSFRLHRSCALRLNIGSGTGTFGCGLGLLLAVGATSGVLADGISVPWVASTGGGEVLSSFEVPLPPGLAIGYPDRISFQVGFSTMESAGPGELFDSLTIGVSNPELGIQATLFTIDGFGLTLAPPTAGGLELDSSSFVVQSTEPLEQPIEGAVFSVAYNIQFEVPTGFADSLVVARFELFDNGDLSISQGYASVDAVPEPGWASLLLVGLLGIGWLRCRSR